MSPLELFTNIIHLYFQSRKVHFSSPNNIERGRSKSISSDLEELIAKFLSLNSSNNQNRYFIDQPVSIEECKGNIYPDILIQAPDGKVEHIIDVKADLGWLRGEGFLEYCLKWQRKIDEIKSRKFCFKSGIDKSEKEGFFSDKLKMYIVIISGENGGSRTVEECLKFQNEFNNINVYIFSDKFHANAYNLSIDEIIKKINIREDDIKFLLGELH
ncbi:hypothetical protein [Pragia fontium]|uniref:hypothetical protein n=1 Tax=Pragia fontium TaxID=82985 RepID=UPI000F6C11A5|nr:hypothetical protein [Pragia fontium]VEJ53811.1 Uncharacterised protein [Pragia fontium]